MKCILQARESDSFYKLLSLFRRFQRLVSWSDEEYYAWPRLVSLIRDWLVREQIDVS
jgi:hypothetical protein